MMDADKNKITIIFSKYFGDGFEWPPNKYGVKCMSVFIIYSVGLQKSRTE